MREAFARHARKPIVALAFCCALGFAAPTQKGPTRLALVIGNSEYSFKHRLHNAAPDAVKVAVSLKKLDFAVSLHQNLNQDQMKVALAEFGKKVKAVGPSAITFVYYSGHAAQDTGQTNFLIPVNVDVPTPGELRKNGQTLFELFADIGEANNPVNVLVLDACRDWFHGDLSVTSYRGLRDIGRQGNMLVAMATGPNATAEDSGVDGSPYSRRLVEALEKYTTLSLSEMFDDIQGKVYQDTGGGQIPEFLNGMARSPRWSLGTQKSQGPEEAPRITPLKTDVIPSTFLLKLDRAKILAFSGGRTAFVDSLMERRDLLAKAGVDTPLRLAHFLTALYAETAFARQEELFSFSANQLTGLYPKFFPTTEIAQEYSRHSERVANRIYAKRMGNGDEASGDGWRFRGRGYLLLTGKAKYSFYGNLIGVDLASYPDLLTDPDINMAVALAYWTQKKINTKADDDDLLAVTRMVVGGAPPARLAFGAKTLKRAKEAVTAQ